GLLHLGNEGEAAIAALALDGLDEAARRGLVMGFGHHFRPGPCGLGRRDLLAFIGFDLLENIGHHARPFDAATRRARVCPALPLSIVSRARAMPSSIVATLSATSKAAPALSSTVSR